MGRLFAAVDAKHRQGWCREVDGAARSVRLHVVEDQSVAGDTLQATADDERRAVTFGVDTVPGEAEQLAEAEPARQHRDERRFEAWPRIESRKAGPARM